MTTGTQEIMSFEIKDFIKKFDMNYCQLCADLKKRSDVIDLVIESGKLEDVTVKLTRINVAFGANQMPKTVCFVCLEKLDKAFEFVIGIEQAQMILNKQTLLQINIKEEPVTEVDLNIQVESVDVKEENCPIIEGTSSKINKTFSDHMNVEKEHESVVDNSLLDKDTWASYSWLCKYCETVFPTIEELRTHSMKYHNSCNPYRCLDCNSHRGSLKKFLKHVRKHQQHLRFSCYKCFERLKTNWDIQKHYKKCHEKNKHICPGCTFGFNTELELNQHKDQYLKTLSTSYNKTANIERRRDYICDLCGKSFYGKPSLESHMITHNTDKPFKCKVCKIAFKRLPQLRNHFTIHTDDKPYKCNECDKNFRLKVQLKSHSLVHTDSFPFQCQHCTKKFRLRQTYRNHLNIHLGIKPYSCDLCQRDFTNYPNYSKHMKRKHDKIPKKKISSTESLEPESIEWLNEMKQMKPSKPGKRKRETN